MFDIASSPDRHTFQRDNYIKRCLEEGKSLDDPNVRAIIDMYNSWALQDEEALTDTKWQENNMEFDMRSSDWMVAKVRASRVYAQNLYAAMCNNEFQKRDLWPILAEQTWSCTWRYAGGIIADMRQEGDYIDWYCSGMGGLSGAWDKNAETLEEWSARTMFVSESIVTEEIRDDLFKLGWLVR